MTFMGLEPGLSDPARSKAAVLSVPYELTTSYGKGTANGPAAIMAASAQLEHYDELRGRSPADEFGIATLDELRPASDDPERAVDEIARGVAASLSPGRLLCVLGGEHAVSEGVARAVAGAAAGPMVAVVLDAHSDLRNEYEGSPHSHACATRRISELMPVLAIGIRSLCEECAEFLDSSDRVNMIFAHEIAGAVPSAAIAGFCRGKSVYLSIDIDCLDPSIMPSTGTPEPGGLTWWQALAVIDEVAGSAESFAAVDVVELAPIAGLSAPDYLAAKLAYRAITAAILGPARPQG